MEFSEVLSKVLEVKSPWHIREIDLHKGTKSVNVFIDYKEGSQFPCADCEQLCNVYDSSYRVWRHLNLFEYRCYLNVKVPRTKCYKHKVRVIKEIPWGRMNIHFSYLFEQEVMALSAEMSMSAVAAKLGEIDTTLWRKRLPHKVSPLTTGPSSALPECAPRSARHPLRPTAPVTSPSPPPRP